MVSNGVLDSLTFLDFLGALPAPLKQWAPLFWQAAAHCQVDPCHLAVICWRESHGGVAPGYTPHGAGGTGDFSKRPAGTAYRQPSGGLYAVPSTGLPDDGKGWGRGLMQIDFGVHHEWCVSHNWADAAVNISKAAELLAGCRQFFARPAATPITIASWRVLKGWPSANVKPWAQVYPRAGAWPTVAPDPRPLEGDALDLAALAAYNAGLLGPLQALACGLPAEAVTAGQNYVTDCINTLAKWKGTP